MKKGFTLIELLAVIVILAIIALIATPIVLNIINDTKKSAVLRSADFYIDALENEIMLENMKQGGNFNPNTCIITNKVISCDSKEINLKVDGEVPTSGTITFEEGKVTDVNLTYQNGNVTLNNKGELVLGESTATTVKTLKDLAVVSEELGVTSIDACTTSGVCEPGTPFAIKVNNATTEKFYVLSDDGNSVVLLLNRNLYPQGNTTNPNIEWINYEDYKAAGGGEYWVACGGDYTHGPITALRALKERTSDWSNINEESYELDYVQGIYKGEYVQNVRARLPKRSDIEPSLGKKYIYENVAEAGEPNVPFDNNTSGYWLSEAVDAFSGCAEAYAFAMHINTTGPLDFSSVEVNNIELGIRPVITLIK